MLNDQKSKRRAQQREQAEPSERSQPIPKLFLIFALALVVWGAAYIATSDSFGPTGMGDRRTVADLAGPTPGASGTADGKQLYTANCLACHQATGLGLSGVFPPLDGSEWVIGDKRVLVNILLHGVVGKMEVLGKSYNGEMPAFSHLSDAELAAVVSYIRSEWSNKASIIPVEQFEIERKSSTRTTPFKGGAELKTLLTKAG